MKTYVFELLQKYCVGAIVVLKSWVRWETDKQPWALTLWKEFGKTKSLKLYSLLGNSTFLNINKDEQPATQQ